MTETKFGHIVLAFHDLTKNKSVPLATKEICGNFRREYAHSKAIFADNSIDNGRGDTDEPSQEKYLSVLKFQPSILVYVST